MKFTANSIKGVTARSSAYRIFEKGVDKGFGLKVTPAGAKSFFVQYAFNGKTRFYNLGRYPSVSLSEARDNCRAARLKIDNGIDPQSISEDLHGSVALLFDYYIARLKEAGKKTADKVHADLLFNCRDILSLPANSIEPTHIREILHTIIERGASVQSNRVRSYLHRAFELGIHHDNDPRNLKNKFIFALRNNPVDSVPKNYAAESIGERTLSFAEIKILWNSDQLSPQFLLAVRLLLLYGCRSWELLGASKNEFDFSAGVWTVPPDRVKNNRYLVLPITDLAHELLTDLWLYTRGSEFLFPGRYDITSMIGRTSLQKATNRVTGISRFVPRDLRRTAKTRMGELGIDKSIRDRIQNHALTDVSSRHYDRWDYLPEKRTALVLWEAALIEHCANHPT